MIGGGIINASWSEGIKSKIITIEVNDWVEQDGVISYTREDQDIEDSSFIPIIVDDSSREIAISAGLQNHNPVYEIGKMMLKADSIPEGSITLTYSIIL